jgi:hypothetical protein
MRDKNGRFLPGISGNPGGRPPEVGDVRELAREYTEEAVATLVDLMRHARSDAARGAAAQALLDRGYGNPWRSPWTWWTMARPTSRHCASLQRLRSISGWNV